MAFHLMKLNTLSKDSRTISKSMCFMIEGLIYAVLERKWCKSGVVHNFQVNYSKWAMRKTSDFTAKKSVSIRLCTETD